MQGISKKEADAYDRMLDAATELAELIESAGFEISAYELEELSVFLAKNSHIVRSIVKKAGTRQQGSVFVRNKNSSE